MRTFKVDVCGFSEINLNWDKINEADQLYARATTFWSRARTQHAQNCHVIDPPRRLYGGTAIIAIENAVARTGSSGSDPSGLGRWSWLELKGAHGTIIVSAYRPTATGTGAETVGNQHRQFLRQNDDDRTPRAAFLADLGKAIDDWHDQGKRVIIGMDANTDVCGTEMTQWAADHLLYEANADRHSPLPATFDRGSKTIDGIFVSVAFVAPKCGLLGFGEGIPSQHRAVWIDMSYNALTGHPEPPTVRPLARRLRLNDPRVVRRYIKSLKTHFHRHNLFSRATNLLVTTTGRLTVEQQEELEAIDVIRLEGMLEAEQNCRRLRTGEVDWNPKLTSALQTKRFLTLLHKRQAGHRVSAALLRRLRPKSAIQVKGPLSTVDLQPLIAQANAAIKEVKSTAEVDRDTFLAELASAYSKRDRTDLATNIRNLQRREKDRKSWRIIRRVFKPPKNEVTTVTAPDSNGVWVEYFRKEEVEGACLFESEGRFRQTEGTPFLNEPLLSQVGPRANLPAADSILKGDFLLPDEVDECTKLILEAMTRPPSADPIASDKFISLKDWTTLWTKTNENTASGKSGIHFGMMKANAADPDLAAFDTALANLSFSTGYTLRRWRPSINVMIPKKATSNRVDKQRIIHLWEADANANFKILARKAMAAGERNGLLAKEQYGSRKDLSAQALTLTKRLIFDISRQQRLPVALCANDARQCYDRIVHSPAALALRRLGAPKEPVDSMFAMLTNLQHHVRTSHGDSERFYDSSTRLDGTPTSIPIQGIGQGNGCGPASWAAISSVVFTAVNKRNRGLLISAPISGSTERFAGFAFVDDTDTFESTTPDEPDLVTRMQNTIDLWEGCLRSTGGALNPDKSFWSVIDYRWDRGKPKYCSTSDHPGSLHMKNAANEQVEVKRIEPSKALETLGVFLAADGNNTDQVSAMRNKSKKTAHLLATTKLSRPLTQRILSTVADKQLTYPLAATTLTRRQCDEIYRPIRQAGLRGLGFSTKLPVVIAHAPTELGGLGFTDLWCEQLATRIQHLVEHGLADNPTGHMIRTTIELLKIEIGLGTDLFSSDAITWGPLTTDSWIQHTWIEAYSASIHLTDPTPNLMLRCAGDWFLNDLARAKSLTERLAINTCRLFLRVTTLADICTGDGSRIDPCFLKYPSKLTIPTSHGWPACHRPGITAWKSWRNFLIDITARRTPASIPLGAWAPATLAPTFPAPWTHPTTKKVYIPTDDGRWETWSRPPRSRYDSLRKEPSVPLRTPPSGCVPTTANPTRRGTRITYTGTRPVAAEPPPPDTFAKFLESSATDVRWAIWPVEGADSGPMLAAAASKGTLIGVSDGSKGDLGAAAAWTVTETDDDGNIPPSAGKVTGVHRTPGCASDQDSYRAELSGLFAQVAFIEALCTFYHINTGSATVALDGLSALNEGTWTSCRKDTIRQHFDLVNAIRRTIRRIPIPIAGYHVRGHQDTGNRTLDKWERLNVEMDGLARMLQSLIASSATIPVTLGQRSSVLRINGQPVVKNFRSAVTRHLLRPSTVQYWSQKFNWEDNQADLIDWDARGKAMVNGSLDRRRFIIQHSTGFSGIGRKMVQRRQATTATCPRCTEEETERHVVLCKGPETNKIKLDAIAALRRRLTKMETAPQLIDAAIGISHRFLLTGGRVSHGHFPHQATSTLVHMQNKIGIHEMLLGFVAKNWRDMQKEFWTAKGIRRSILTWASHLVEAFWDIFWAMWRHRNICKHSTEARARSTTIDDDLNDKIRRIWDRGRRSIPSHDRTIFRGSLRDRLDKPRECKRSWLAQAEAVFARAERRLEEQHGGARRVMRRWLQSQR